MGLFSSDTYYCTVCGGEAQSSNAEQCSQCGSVIHHRCLKNTGNAKKEGRFLRSDKVKLRCPDCGNVGSI
ncbi:hypothetical protein [Halobellus sp. GM3]|uniref:hypothetical protein n=1 Tax=Halobellus sp. GM3 TaxID=3458410 RepID=UPI00403E0664